MNKEEIKKEKVDEFFEDLKEFISAIANDAIVSNADCWDSMAGMSSYGAESKLGESLYKLFDIEE